jgi:Uncharacterized protein conserved in bacteria (DUF2252)
MAVKEAAPRSRRINPNLNERLGRGRAARDRPPPSSHARWSPAADRPDQVSLLEEQNRTREPDLVPVRHGRMMASPFSFYRGSARIMAADLAGTPVAGLGTQLCGNARLSNLGMFASPERRLLFDLNDFDEILSRPFEYDVKRMATSFVIASRNSGFARAGARAEAFASVTAFQEAVAGFTQMPTMGMWYAYRPEDQLAKAHSRESVQALSKLGEGVGGQYRIVSQSPVIVPARDLAGTFGLSPDEVVPALHDQFHAYQATLQDDRRHLLERFEIVDMARKVVGVGSIGTRAVVQGQRLMRAASDIFLDWIKGLDTSRYFYWRQLRDMKGPALVELMAPITLTYLAGDEAFDQSVTDFCERYADQNEQDYEEFVKAVRSGRLEAVEGV